MVQKRSLLAPAKKQLDPVIMEKIKRRRRQIMVHSLIYYRMSTNLIDDKIFDKWAYELVDLQKNYPEESKEVELYDDFKDWDGSTGFNLNYFPFWHIAERLLNYRRTVDEHSKV